MKFWRIEYCDIDSDVVENTTLASPKIYLKNKVLEIITKTHPEWKNIKLLRIKKPSSWRLYGTS